jgi:hypothetical protein
VSGTGTVTNKPNNVQHNTSSENGRSAGRARKKGGGQGGDKGGPPDPSGANCSFPSPAGFGPSVRPPSADPRTEGLSLSRCTDHRRYGSMSIRPWPPLSRRVWETEVPVGSLLAPLLFWPSFVAAAALLLRCIDRRWGSVEDFCWRAELEGFVRGWSFARSRFSFQVVPESGFVR